MLTVDQIGCSSGSTWKPATSTPSPIVCGLFSTSISSTASCWRWRMSRCCRAGLDGATGDVAEEGASARRCVRLQRTCARVRTSTQAMSSRPGVAQLSMSGRCGPLPFAIEAAVIWVRLLPPGMPLRCHWYWQGAQSVRLRGSRGARRPPIRQSNARTGPSAV